MTGDPSPDPPAPPDPDQVFGLLAQGEAGAALDKLRAGLDWPRGRALTPSELPRWVAALAALVRTHGDHELADLADQVVHDPDSPDQLYQLGYALIDAGAPGLAASVLWHCLGLVGESEEVVCELVSALEAALAHRDAFELLARHEALRAHGYLPRYLYAFNAAMIGQLEITRAVLPSLAPGAAGGDGASAEHARDHEVMYGTIAGIVERADRLAGASPLDTRDLRGWHYVLTGGLVTHQSPYGFDAPMHGRYAWLADSVARVSTGITRLGQLVHGMALPCVYAPPGRADQILAHAVAARLGLPLAPWPAVGVPAPGLIVVYDLAALPPEYVPQLVQRRPAQVLYAHASPWTADSPVAPDVTMLLYQALVPPWGTSTLVDPDTRQATTIPADDRPIDVIATELAAAEGLPDDELTAEQPERWAALVARAWPPQPTGRRARLWAAGPVPSNRFA